MTQNYLFIIFLIELAVFYLIVYSLIKADRWVKAQCGSVNSSTPTIIDAVRALRDELKRINSKLQELLQPKVYSHKEISVFLTEALTDLIKSFIPGFSIKRKFLVVRIIIKLFKNRRRVAATFFKN